MSTRKPAVSVGLSRGRRRGVGRVLDRSAQAQRGAELEFVRTAGPRAVAQMLARLEAKGEIVAANDVSADEESFDLDAATDVEINLEDEDLASVEIWQEHGSQAMDAVALGGDATREDPLADDVYELTVQDGVCGFPAAEWAWAYNPTTQSAKEQLNEIAARSRVFRALTVWLNDSRPAFLASRQFWELGPANLEEVIRGCSATQKDLLAMLRLKPPVREESFSRFLNQCQLVWPDGSAPVQILFSKQARMAWVAHAVLLFAQKYPGRPLEERLNDVKSTTLLRTGRNSVGFPAKLGSMKFDKFIQLVNQEAGNTSWEEVLREHRSRMISEYAHAKEI